MDNRALQEDELLVLESIYNSDEFNRTEHSNLLGGRLHIYHELPKDFKIIVKRYLQSSNIGEKMHVLINSFLLLCKPSIFSLAGESFRLMCL